MSFQGVTKKTADAVYAEFGNCCAACGTADRDHLATDHVQPRGYFESRREPVDNSPRNIQILCHACNNIKGNIPHMSRLTPRAPVFDAREAMVNRDVWRATVAAAKGANPHRGLWD